MLMHVYYGCCLRNLLHGYSEQREPHEDVWLLYKFLPLDVNPHQHPSSSYFFN